MGKYQARKQQENPYLHATPEEAEKISRDAQDKAAQKMGYKDLEDHLRQLGPLPFRSDGKPNPRYWKDKPYDYRGLPNPKYKEPKVEAKDIKVDNEKLTI